ncbi:hypothetical protein TI39_contig5824g00018 [Zymoseptoria brevis]|uniref:Mur ligase central domain-containing protein n=1 Tax=Zymoseptoria brevis TaxID=1047168 RepID=A0A0F4G627_9PEZI|nr:hypothetical protein TI39_contig5824g00018 [Zymoseptoria brevis]
MIELGLQRISRLLYNTPIPWRAIHVAGTNGKGSVCTYISRMLQVYNGSEYRASRGHRPLRLGSFTSPHLIDRWDCIGLSNYKGRDIRPVSSELFHAVEKIVLHRNREADIRATEFELLTATAFEIFSRAQLDVAVVEVGVGGRLDATNILGQPYVDKNGFPTTEKPRPLPLVSVITKVGMDHQGLLGNTIEEIAREKAGIAKPPTRLVYDHTNSPEVKEVLKQAGTRSLNSFKYGPQIAESLTAQSWLPHVKANAMVAAVATQAALEGLDRLDSNDCLATREPYVRLRWTSGLEASTEEDGDERRSAGTEYPMLDTNPADEEPVDIFTTKPFKPITPVEESRPQTDEDVEEIAAKATADEETTDDPTRLRFRPVPAVTQDAENEGVSADFTRRQFRANLKNLSWWNGLSNRNDQRPENANLARSSIKTETFQSLQTAMAEAVTRTIFPGRQQWINIRSLTGRRERALLDGAHNPQAAEVLNHTVSAIRGFPREEDASAPLYPITWVVAMTKGKEVAAFFEKLLLEGDNVVAVEFGPVDGMPWVEAMASAELIAEVREVMPDLAATGDYGRDLLAALKAASEMAEKTPGQKLVIAGSLYLVGDTLRLLRDTNGNRR